jgi:hypothetical protein
VPLKPIRPFAPPRETPCNAPATVSEITSKLGLSLSAGDVARLVNAIRAGGDAGTALATSIADAIANADYEMSAQLLNTVTVTLNQPENGGLLLTHVIRSHLAKFRPRPPG